MNQYFQLYAMRGYQLNFIANRYKLECIVLKYAYQLSMRILIYLNIASVRYFRYVMCPGWHLYAYTYNYK